MILQDCESRRTWPERHLKVLNNKGQLLGEIQELHLGVNESLGGEPTVYIAVQRGRNYGIKACNTLLDAYHYIGISTKEVDQYYIDLVNGKFAEK